MTKKWFMAKVSLQKNLIIFISKVSHCHVFYNNSNDLCLHGMDFMPPHKRLCGEGDPHSIDMSTILHTNPCIKGDSIPNICHQVHNISDENNSFRKGFAFKS